MKPKYFSYVAIFLLLFLSVSFFARADAVSGEWCHTITNIESVSSMYGSPINLFSEIHEPLVTVNCLGNESSVVHVGSGESTQYIYKYGYRKVNGKWTKTTLSGDLSAGEWLIGSATANIEGLDAGEEGKMLVYVCQKVGYDWKCGCADNACKVQKWQLQEYKLPSSTTNTSDADDLTQFDDEEAKELDVHYPTRYLGLPGETITLMGAGFSKSPLNSVLWNGDVQETGLSSLSGGTLTITVPSLPPGKYKVEVKVGKTISEYGVGIWIGTGDNSPVPVITHFSPQSGPQGGTFTVYGSGFTKENDLITTYGLLSGLPSEDGTSIVFSYDPFDEKLVKYNENGELSEYVLPINVTIMNTSGQSNMMIFNLNI